MHNNCSRFNVTMRKQSSEIADSKSFQNNTTKVIISMPIKNCLNSIAFGIVLVASILVGSTQQVSEPSLKGLSAMETALAGGGASDNLSQMQAQSVGTLNMQPKQQLQQAQQQASLKLPNINIYINNNELKKLLGLDKRIYYVRNGEVDAYPLTFSIPLGYNQSDIIFTWQNLGPTNVNYSISLVISNYRVVDAPLINITRTGLIPRNEQVFKITLPCSGKVTDETDVQVLINVSGQVLVDEEPLGVLGADSAQDSELPAAAPRASQAAAAAAAAENSTTPNASPADAPQQATGAMQADEPARRTQFVSHTLAIKRKKICTMHPVPAPVPWIHPPNQAARPPPQLPPPQARPQAQPQDRWPQSETVNKSAPAISPPLARSGASAPPPPLAEPEHHPALQSLELPEAALPPQTPPQLHTNRLRPYLAPPPQAPAQVAQQPQLQFPPAGYPTWPIKPVGPQQQQPLAEDPIDELVRQAPQQQTTSYAIDNTLVLVLGSLIISVALVSFVLLLTSRRQPLEKLNALTSCILKRTSVGGATGSRRASAAAAQHHCKSPAAMKGAMIASLRPEPKSAVSSVSGLSAALGGQQQHSKGAYCFKPSPANSYQNGYYTMGPTSNQQQQHHHNHHHYQHPPTADLLGTGYQCQQQQQYPIYHIATGNQSQTTRLIWNNGNGTSADGFTIDGGSYMPLSNAPRSDSGSVYQTIY